MSPETRDAKAFELDIASRVVGDGPLEPSLAAG